MAQTHPFSANIAEEGLAFWWEIFTFTGMNSDRKKKVADFTIQVIVCTIIFTGCLYIWSLLDHGITGFDWSFLVQGVIFSLIYVPLSSQWKQRKSK